MMANFSAELLQTCGRNHQVLEDHRLWTRVLGRHPDRVFLFIHTKRFPPWLDINRFSAKLATMCYHASCPLYLIYR